MSDVRISPEESQNLEWYFSEGKSTFCRSVTGDILDKAKLYRYGGIPCLKCQDYPGVDPITGDWCERCKGTGYIPYELGKKQEDTITAWPTAEVQEAGGYEPDEKVLSDFGMVARRLDRLVQAVGSIGPVVLEAFHGDAGARWGETSHGRLFALFALTPAGQKILQRIRNKEEDTETYDNVIISASEKLGVQAELQKTQPKAWRKELMEKAHNQAERLYNKVASAWMETGRRLPVDTGKKKRVRKNQKWVDSARPANDTCASFHQLRKDLGMEA